MADALLALLSSLEDEIQDPEEETFLLYSSTIPLQGLGFIDSQASSLDLQVNGKDVTIHQSPGVLASSRKGGTTGAEWLSSPTNPLATVLTNASVVELGCGISPLNALSLAHKVSRYILTDQPYVQKLVLQNLASNLKPSSSSSSSSSSAAASTTKSHASRSKKGTPKPPSPPSTPPHPTTAEIHFDVLDWETSQVTPSLTHSPAASSFDAVLSCDCVYNYALIPPFVQTCVDICTLRSKDTGLRSQGAAPCLCIVAQQLRTDDVFNTWLAAFRDRFRVWRVPGERMPEGLRPEAGFVVHVGILKDSF
ncbi:hypothetical protein J3F83DRAFT_765625 [Trichoderma novae-zelandiae]